MNTMQIFLSILGLAASICLFAFSSFFRTRKMALALFFFGWQVFIAGFIGGAFTTRYDWWAWIVLAAFIAGTCFAIFDEYKLWRKSLPILIAFATAFTSCTKPHECTIETRTTYISLMDTTITNNSATFYVNVQESPRQYEKDNTFLKYQKDAHGLLIVNQKTRCR